MAFDPREAGAQIADDFDPHAMGAVPAILEQAEQQAYRPEIRSIQPQEEFANPTQYHGFKNLPRGEQLQRISNSQFDPANMTSLGGVVPPGTYESEPARMAGSVLPTLAVPELSAGQGIVSRYAINPLLNLASRIGQGTASNVLYNSPDIRSVADLQEQAKRGGIGSVAVEAMTMPFRVPAYFSEMFNPVKYGVQKSQQIRNELAATKATTDAMYKPVNDKYDGAWMTATPKNYLRNLGVKRKDLMPDAKLIYDDFMQTPTFGKLHDLQSKLGTDWARISQSPAHTEKAQLFAQQRDSIKGAIQGFLQQDQNALNQYNLATDYAKNNYYPYISTPTLRKIAKGKMDVSPNALSKSIQRGVEKTVGSGKFEKSVIPEGHALRGHMDDINRMINFGQAAQIGVPTVMGAAGGHFLAPGYGTAAGALGGLGASYLATPKISGFIQNPMIQGLFENTAPLYYAGGRTAVNALNQNK